MRTRLNVLLTVSLLALIASSAELRAQSEIVYRQNFESFAVQANPPGWTDTLVGQISGRRRAVTTPGGSVDRTATDPMDARNVVFGAGNATGDEEGSTPRFGMFATQTSTTFAQSLDFSGRMFRGSERTRVGVSFFSGYPDKDRYYLLALAPQDGGRLTMQLFGYGAGTLAGARDSGFTVEPNVWYRFHITVEAGGASTSIQAHFWRDGLPEPAMDSINASDFDVRRLRAGHVGMWSAIGGSAFVDDLSARSTVPAAGIDTTAPVISIYESGVRIDPSTRPSFAHDVAFDIHVQDESAFSVSSTLDASPYTSAASISGEGSHVLVVVATDIYGNRSEVTLTFTIVRVTSQPAIAIVSPAANDLLGNAHLTVSGTIENAATVTVNSVPAQVDLTAKRFVATGVNLLEGPNSITAIATNSVGLTATATSSVIVDTRAPDLAITAPAQNHCADTTVIDIRGQAFDPTLRSVKIIAAGATIDAILAGDGTWSATIAAPVEGAYTLTVLATDALGHLSSALVTTLVDRSAPAIDVRESGVALEGVNTNRNLTPLVRVTDADPHSTTAVTLDGAPYLIGTSIAAAGSHELKVAAEDCAGHRSQKTVHFTIDRTAPQIISVNPEAGATIGSARSITGMASSDAIRITVQPFGQSSSVENGAFTINALPLAEGTNELTFIVVDRAGNTSSTPYAVTLKSNGPAVDILVDGDSIATGALFNREIRPVLRSDDPNATISATLNGRPYASGSAIGIDGSYTLSATATDAVGHTTTTTATFVVDRTPPSIKITQPGNDTTVMTDTVVLRGDVSTDAVLVSVNGVTAGIDGGTFSVTVPLESGPNDLVAVARDRAGNFSSVHVAVTRSGGPRGIILTAPPDHLITNRSTTLVAGQVLTSASDAKVTISGNDVAVDPSGVFRKSDFALTEGENLIVATVTTGGNTNQVSVHVVADRTPPRLRLLESGRQLADESHFPDHAVISAAASDNGQNLIAQLTVDGAPAAQPATITAVGGHAIVATARDPAGNESRVERTIFIGANGSSGCILERFDPPDGSVVTSNTVTITGRSGGSAGVKINGFAAFVANGSFCATVELPNEGDNSIAIVCTDGSGNPTGTSASLAFRRVTGDPSISIARPEEGSTVATDVISVTGATSAGVSSVDVNGVAATVSSNSFTANGVRLANGLNVIAVRAHNAAGRIATASRRVVYVKDPPAIAITSPAAALTTGSTHVDVSGDWSNLDPSTLTVAGAPAQAALLSDTTGTFIAGNVPLREGRQTITVSGRDATGRAATATIDVTSTSGAPSISIGEPADNAIFGNSASATFTVRGTFTAANGANVDVGGTAATIDGSNFTATIPFSTFQSGVTPVIGRVMEPSGASSVDTIRVQRISTGPRVIDSFPPANAAEIDGGALPLVLFSAPMDRASLTNAFRLETSAGVPVNGTFRLDRDVLTFAPAALLTGGGSYTMHVTAGARDVGGNALSNEFSSTFTVAASAPGTPPVVIPLDAASCAQQKEIHGTAAPGSRLRLDYGSLSMTTSAAPNGAFTFRLPLSGQSGCQVARVRIVGSDGTLSPATEVRFQVDCNGPQVTAALFDRAANRLAITFTKEMKPATLVVAQTGSVLLQLNDGRFVAGAATVQSNTATISPGEDLTQKSFTLTVTTVAEDTTGAKLGFAYSQAFPFETEQTPPSTNGLGFISGEVYEDDTGRPLSGATVTIEIPSASAIATATDARGRYAAQLPEGAHTIRVSSNGYVTSWRQIIVAAGAGVIPIDVRLAKKGRAQTVTSGDVIMTHGNAGMVGLAPVELRAVAGAILPGKSIALTSLAAQSLPGLLPLGWSPLAAASVDSDAGSMAGTQLTFTISAPDVNAAAQQIAAIQYHDDRDEWQVITPAVSIGSDGKVILPISVAGSYALVYGDRAPGLTRPRAPLSGETLQGVADSCSSGSCPPLAARSFTIEPPVVVPTGRSVVTLKINGDPPAVFPSGTAVQAYVDEELQLAGGSQVSDPPFTTDLLLYRNLSGDTGVAQLQLAPSTKAAEVVLQVGFDHIRIMPYPGRLDRGTLIGAEGGRVPGDGRVSIDIAPAATADALRATSTAISDFSPFGSIAGFTIASGFTLTLQRANAPDTTPPVELLTPARVTFNGFPSTPQYVLAEVLDDTPFGRMYRLAASMVVLEGGRLVTNAIDRSALPLDGVVREGRYLLLAANAPIAFATGTVRIPGSAYVAGARVTTLSLGITDRTRAGGIFNIVVPAKPAAPFTLVPRTLTTGDGATYTSPATPDPGAIVHVGELALLLQPPQLASTIPSAGAVDVSLTTIVKATFTPGIDPQSINATSISLTDDSGTIANGLVSAEGGNAVVWTLQPGQRLQPNRRYTATINASIRGTNGAPFARNDTFSFATVTQLASTDVHREKIRILIPDAAGHSQVVGDAGALPASWQAVLTRRGHDYDARPQATAAGDGSFVIDIPGTTALTDLIDLQVINSVGSMSAMFELTPFVSADGKSFIAPADRDTRFTTADGKAGVTVPAGAFPEATTITLTPADPSAFGAVPNIDREFGLAAAVNIDFAGVAAKRLELEIATPSGTDPNASWYLGRLGQSVLGPRVEIVDTLRVANGRFTTTPGASGANAAIAKALRPGISSTFGDPQESKNAMIAVLRGGTYDATRFTTAPSWLLIDVPVLGGGFDVFSNTNDSIFLSGLSLLEKRGRTLFPVKANVPFQLVGYDSSTGLEAFRIDRAGGAALDPLNAIPTAILTANDSGPYPVFAVPARLEIVEAPPDGVTLTSVRGLAIRQQNGQVTIAPSLGAPALPTLNVLDITNGRFAAGREMAQSSVITMQAATGDRLLISVDEKNVDPEQTMAIAFSSAIDLNGLTDERRVDDYLHQTDWFRVFSGEDVQSLASITPQVEFAVDSAARRVAMKIPLSRGKLYRIIVRGTVSGPPIGGQPGLKLGQRSVSGTLVPANPNDISFEFTTRAPGGELARMALPDGKGGIRDFGMTGNVGFIATTGGGLQAFDISDPAKFSSVPPSPPLRRAEGVTDYWTVTADRHGRVYAAGLNETFAVLHSYRVEDFIDPPAALPDGTMPALKPTSGTNVAWRVGVNAGVPIGTDILMTDRPEGIPRRVQVLLQDDETPQTRAQLEASAAGAIRQIGDVDLFDVSVPVPGSLKYFKQRVTIENRTLGARWSADIQRGRSGVIKGVIAARDDELLIARNVTTYGVVSLFGYGVSVYDLNAVESNDMAEGNQGYVSISERVLLTAANGDPQADIIDPYATGCAPGQSCRCNPSIVVPTGASCEIRDLQFSPDALLFPAATSSVEFIVYAVDQRRGLLDMHVVPPQVTNPGPPPVVAPAQTTIAHGLVLAEPYTAPSGGGILYHPRLRSLHDLYLANAGSGGAAPRARFTSASPYLRTNSGGTSENYALIAGNSFGLLVVRIDGNQLTNDALVGLVWIPAGALAVRVIPRSDLALVVDNAGRVMLVDLRNLNESSKVTALPSCTNESCVAALFPTAKASIAAPTPPLPPGADWIEVGVDDPRIIWKSAPKTVLGNIPPMIDPDTGILISGDLNGNRVAAIAAIDPHVQFRIRTDNGPKFVNSIVPLGVSPKTPFADPESSYAAFRIQLSLPGSITESLTSASEGVRLAIESERVPGAVAEQTPVPLPPAHLRKMTRSGTADPRASSVADFRMQRSVPYDPSDPQLKSLRYQRAYNRFLSPWIVAVADPRASENYQWGNSDPVTQGCRSCKRPTSLRGKRAPEVFEMMTRGRIISVRSETDLFANTRYAYLGDKDRLLTRVATTMSDTVRTPIVAVAAQNPPVAGGAVEETTYLHSGEVETAAVDLEAGGRNGFDVVISRTYRSRTIGAGFLGTSWDSPVFKRLRELPNGTVEYRNGAGDIWEFQRTNGTTYQAPPGVFLTLAATDQGWDLSDQRKRISKFDKLGRITRDVDEYFDEASRAGNSISYLYDNSGRLTTIVDPVGRVTTLDYSSTPDADGLLQSVSDWRQRKLEYKYDTSRRLTGVQLANVMNSDGARPATRYEYSAATSSYNDRLEIEKELTSITDPHEVATSGPARVRFEYDTSGDTRDHVSRQTWGTQESVKFSYNSPTEVIVTDSLNQDRVYTITGTGAAAHITTMVEKQVLTASAPFGELPRSIAPGRIEAAPQDRIWSFTYDPEGMMLTSDLNGLVQTRNGFGSTGSVPGELLRTSTTNAAGANLDSISRTYNYTESAGAFLQSVQTSGSGSLITLNVPEPTRENVTRANASPLDSTNDSITSWTNYDRAGRPTGSKSSGGTVPGGGSNAQYTYEPDNSSQQFERGEIASVTEGSLSTRYQYDTADQTTVTDPRSVMTTTGYDAWRRPTKIERSGQPGSSEQFEYDATGRLHKHHERQSGETITTTYEYDAMGRQKTVTRNHVDVGGSLTSVTTRFDYDFQGRKQTTFLPGGGSVIHEVDGLGRVTRVITTTGVTPIENRYTYDIAGNRVYATDMKVAIASAFDVHGREILTLNADGTKTRRSFDAGGRPKSVVTTSLTGSPVEKSFFTFSDMGRMQSSNTAIDTAASRTTQIGWDGAGRTTAVNVAGRGMLQTFDSAGLLLSSKTGEGSLTSIARIYTDQTYGSHTGTLPQEITTKEKTGAAYSTQRTFDDNANVSRENVGGLEWKQQFDEAGNVTSASQPQRPPATYAYDSRGAVTNETKPDGATNGYAYDATGVLARYTDPASERTTDELDLLGRPGKRIYADGTIELFTYDGARLASYTDRQGRIQNFTYNDRGQLSRIDRNGGAQLDQLVYDDAGRLSAWTNKDSRITWEDFNLDGRPSKTTLTVYQNGTGFGVRQVAGTFEQNHKWDEHGERTEWTMPRAPNFASTLPWTDRVREARDAKGNVVSVERSLFTGGGFTSLMTADFRNAARPDQRTLTTSCGSVPCRSASIVRSYDYDAATGLLDTVSVSSGPIVVAGSRITRFDGTQIGEARILGVSGGAHAQRWSYDSRSRLRTTAIGRASTQNLSPADFRAAVERVPRLDPATRAQLAARGVNVDRIDPPSQTAAELRGHKVGNVAEGASVRTFSYNGSERQDDGTFRYEFDEKGRLTRATRINGLIRVTYTYDGDDRMITRRVETGRAGTWTVATSDILTDGLPADAIFVWDPITDRLAAVFDATSGAISRQVLHGGLGYDDPIEVTLTEPADTSKINRLYPIYDEAAAGHLQAVVNASGEMVSRKIVADAYGDDSFSIAGAAIDLVQVAAKTDSSGAPSQIEVTLRATEELAASTVPAGVRLAAVDASGKLLRTATVQPSLANANTAKFTLTASQWNAMTANAAGVSIAVTKDLRASAWSANVPLLPAPEWATATRPVFTTPDTPIEIRESLGSLAPWLTSIGPNSTKSNTLYEVTDLALIGSDSDADDPARFLVASPFHALPFLDSVTRLTQVRARWLDHSTGAFLTVDPMGYRDSANLYAYCAGDPVNSRDPLGLALYAFDGTWNDRDDATQPRTNVAKLASSYKRTVQYEVGVGTNWYTSLQGGLSGAGASARVKDAYRRLEENYRGGDTDIDIIGFSRGSAEAVQFANVINEKGVHDRNGQIVHPKIRFLGLYDMVGSIGVPGTNLNPGFNLTVPPNVERARMAIAANEYRGTFPLSHISNPMCLDERIVEKPFRGAHSDAGGGYDDPTLARKSLNWMWEEMVKAGLPMKPLSPSDHNVTSSGGTAHASHDSWKFTPTRIRLWWDEKTDQAPTRKEYFPPCSAPVIQ